MPGAEDALFLPVRAKIAPKPFFLEEDFFGEYILASYY
jgi:hypothetical protein